MRYLIVLLAALPAFAQVEYLNPKTMMRSPRYSQLAIVNGGGLVFISGQAATGIDGKLVGEGDFKAQAEQVFRNLRDALTAAGATPNDVVSIETFFLRAEDLPAYREARTAFFGKRIAPPATSTTVIVSGLVVPGALLEVSAVAVVPARAKKK